jgi:hypothetical protein
LDGDTGYISTPDHADFTLGAGDWTFDFWIKYPDLLGTTTATIFSKRQDANNYYRLQATVVDYGIVKGIDLLFTRKEGAVLTNYNKITTIPDILSGAWHHIELCNSGGHLLCFVDGVLYYTDAWELIEFSDITGAFEIGRFGDGSDYLNAYIDEFRYSLGVARHTANFTPATSAYKRATVDDEYTALLFHITGTHGALVVSDVLGLTSFTDYTASTLSSTINTSQYKFSPASFFCGGTDASKGIATTVAGTAPRARIWYRSYATIDTWVRFVDFAAVHPIYTMGVQIQYDQTGANKRFTVNATSVSITDALVADTWYHFAFVKNGMTLSIYIDGVLAGTIDITTAIASWDTVSKCAAQRVGIGCFIGYGVSNAYFDEYRISPDIQRWTSNFTPPTEEYGSIYFDKEIIESITVSDLVYDLSGDLRSDIASISDVMEAVREVPGDTDEPATFSDDWEVVKQAERENVEPFSLSDVYDTQIDFYPLQVESMGISDIFDAEQNYYEPGLFVTLPGLTFEATGQDGAVGTLNISIPALIFSSQGSDPPRGTINVTLPPLFAGLNGQINEQGTLTVTLPALLFSGTEIAGTTGVLSVSLPALEIDFSGNLSAEGTLTVSIPMFKMASDVLPDSYLNMVLNIRNAALTLYDNYDFNSLCRFNGKHFGATKTGIFDLDTGDLDGDDIIDWNFRTGFLDMEQKTTKKLRQAWLSYKSSGNIMLTVIQPDGTEYEYTLEGIENDDTGLRVKFGRGLASKYVALDIKGVDGSTITLDTLRLTLDKLSSMR